MARKPKAHAWVTRVKCPKCGFEGAFLQHPDREHILELRCQKCDAEYALESPHHRPPLFWPVEEAR